MLTFTNVVLSVVFLLIIPTIIGSLSCEELHINYGFANWYAMGWFSLWAVSQLILVPMVLMDVSFTVSCIVLLLMYLILIVVSLFRLAKYIQPKGAHSRKVLSKTKFNISMILFIILILTVTFILYQNMILQHSDADDSRFVVLAMDTIKSDRMLRINPTNGRTFTGGLGEVQKDFSSPWPVYVAFLANMCGVKATVMFHTILPYAMYILVTCCFWMIGDKLFKGDFDSKCIFTNAVVLIYIFGNYSSKSAETFIMSRIWQGKAIVAGAGIPMIICSMIRIYKKPELRAFIQLLIIDLALCLLSGMGIVIGAIMMTFFGLTYAVLKRNYLYFIYPVLISLINGSFYLINQNAVSFL